MSRIRGILYGSISATMGHYRRARSFLAYNRCISISRFSIHGLPTALGNCASANMGKRKFGTLPVSALVGVQQLGPYSSTNYPSRSINSRQLVGNKLNSGHIVLPFSLGGTFFSRSYSSHPGGKQDSHLNVPPNSTGEASDTAVNTVGNEWIDSLNHAWQSTIEATTNAGEKVKEISGGLEHIVQQLYGTYPYLEKIIVPVGGTLSATVVAWFIMPKVLRKIHKYAVQGPLASLSLGTTKEPIPYEKSLWSALEDPARYLTIFMVFSQLGVMIAPATSQYQPQAWRGSVVLSFMWFLHRWKTNFFSNAMANQVTVGLDRGKLMALEKVSSIGLIILGVLALAEACGVAVQSILTVGGIGGVATAFASRDILGNLLSGLSVQLSKPFEVGDNIKAGSIEGQVVELGLTTTCLINPDKFHVIVPNSLFSSQVIINKSRAQWRAIMTKIPLRIHDLDKIPLVSEEIKSMLRSHPRVFLEKDAPYCYLSRIENSFAELTLGCNLINMRRDEMYATEQDILLQAANIIKQHGAVLGNTVEDNTGQSFSR